MYNSQRAGAFAAEALATFNQVRDLLLPEGEDHVNLALADIDEVEHAEYLAAVLLERIGGLLGDAEDFDASDFASPAEWERVARLIDVVAGSASRVADFQELAVAHLLAVA